MYEVFILDTPFDYQKQVDKLQKEGYEILFIQATPQNDRMIWVVTARRNVNVAPKVQSH